MIAIENNTPVNIKDTLCISFLYKLKTVHLIYIFGYKLSTLYKFNPFVIHPPPLKLRWTQ